MTARRSYLDHNASVPLLPEAREAMLRILDIDANPSSVHAEGRQLRRVVEDSRRAVATLCGARGEHVVFTSGATEAASMLLCPDWTMGLAPLRMSRLYVSAADHPCLLGGGHFSADRLEIVGVDGNGIVDFDALESALARHDDGEGLPLVAIHWANNETGVVQPVRRIGEIVKAAGGMLVVDAVQAAGRVPLDISGFYADFLILSSHKIGGPKGAGAIVATSDLAMPRPLVRGGGQERGHRGGTENVAAIAGFASAAREATEGLATIGEVAAMRDRFETTILNAVPDATIYGRQVERIANTVYFGIPGLKAETAQIAFDLAGVAVSAGSACSSGKVGSSTVLKAMGAGDDAGAIRVSIGRATGQAELNHFGDALVTIASRRGRQQRAA